MPKDRSDRQFDRMLAKALKGRSEAVPADFTDRMMVRVDSLEQQRILRGIVVKQRLVLAGSLLFGAAVCAVGFFFASEIAGIMSGAASGAADYVSSVRDSAVGQGWSAANHKYIAAGVGAIVLFGLYGLVDLVFGGRIRLV